MRILSLNVEQVPGSCAICFFQNGKACTALKARHGCDTSGKAWITVDQTQVVYMLRHIRTGLVMPQLPTQGYSYWNPDDYVDLNLETPRLFSSQRKAEAVRRSWARGKRSRDFETGRILWESPRKSAELEVIYSTLSFESVV